MAYNPSIMKNFSDETSGLAGEYWVESLKNGTPLLIRELAATDRASDLAFCNELGDGMPHFHFLGSFSNRVDLHDQLMDIDRPHRMAYIALAYEGNELTQVGTARYGAYAGDAHCEFAVAVCERWQRQGIATSLLQHLMDTATRQGFGKISSMDASGNVAMHGLAQSMGFTSRADDSHGPRIFHEYVLASAVPAAM